tara:strand:- start:369 stop:677 length:309 start_codon:yes stop_codon:yes gene_type:complete
MTDAPFKVGDTVRHKQNKTLTREVTAVGVTYFLGVSPKKYEKPHRIDEWEKVPEKKYGWINVYPTAASYPHDTKNIADNRAADTDNRIGCIKVELREEFDDE